MSLSQFLHTKEELQEMTRPGAGPAPCLAQGSCPLEAALTRAPVLAPEEDSGAWDHQAQQSLLSASFP